jgi:drug/metabolite transporter (DMT)-like permease
MKTAIFYAMSATAFWGLAFPLPLFIPQFSFLEIVLGRYLMYGLLSLFILAVSFRKARHYHYSHILKTGLVFAMTGSLVYYCFLLLGIRLAGAPISALFVGILPVTIPVYGNWSRREFTFSILILPISLIFAGLLLINADNAFLSHNTSLHASKAMITGILCNIAALALWTWFGVANANFLKSHPEISSEEWSTIIGISTLLGTIALGLLLLAAVPDMFYLRSHDLHTKDLLYYIGVISVLGFGVSWYATVLWNRASAQLPISLLGQLIIFETIFGLFYIFIKEMKYPTFFEISGISSALLGLFLCFRSIRSKKRDTTPFSSGSGLPDRKTT